MSRISFAGLAAASLTLAACASAPSAQHAWPTLSGAAPIVIAHRGASGLRPEHTLASYDLAITHGADFIEPDLVMTKDGVLVCRHDRHLSTTTDVAGRPEFADRRRPDDLEGSDGHEDWWVEDFTLAELKTLRAVQPFAGRSTAYDGQFEIPTFEEVIALAKRRGAERGRPVGLYPETKHPSHFARIGLSFEQPLIDILTRESWTGSEAPVFIQSFEPEILIRLNAVVDTPLVQLVYPVLDPAVAIDPAAGLDGLALIASVPLEDAAAYADGVGPAKLLLIDWRGDATDYVSRAHALGLEVHPWTFRDDQAPYQSVDAPAAFAPELERDGDRTPIDAEFARIFALGVDGVFSDFPGTAVRVRAVVETAAP